MESIIKKLGKTSVTVEKDYHNSEKEYNKLTIVEEKDTFKTYLSRKPVPVGIALTNREYWICFSGVLESITFDYLKFKKDYASGKAIEDNAIITRHILDRNIERIKIALKAISEEEIDDNAIIERTIKDRNITSNKIAKENILTEHFAKKSVITSILADYIITAIKLADNSVTTRSIADENITDIKLANNAVTTRSIAQESIIEEKFANNSVSTRSLIDKSITKEKLAENSVTESKIADNNITNRKIANNTIDITKFDSYTRNIIESVRYIPEEFTSLKEAIFDEINKYKPIIINGDVTNAADEEDITSENNLLKLKDRSSINGMGYVILRKNKSFAEQVTKKNTIYEIRYDFTLDEDITVPSNCILKFDGGSINGEHTLNLNNKSIIKADYKIFDYNVIIIGITSINVEWFGITPTSTDNSIALNHLTQMIKNALTWNNDYYWLIFKEAKYNVESTVTIDGRINICGNPTFYMTNSNTTCVYIKNSWQAQYEFNVERPKPTICKNHDSIGVIVENCMYSKFNIHRIQCFTKGIIVRADGGEQHLTIGCGWNDFYIDCIYSPVWGFEIESKRNGWPNANNVFGGMGFNSNTAWIDYTDNTLPTRGVVMVSDGEYGANGWSFSGTWFEDHGTTDKTPDGLTYYAIDFCDYINGAGMTGCLFNNTRLEYTPRVAKIDSRYSKGIKLIYSESQGYNMNNHYALDYDGTIILDPSIYSVVPEFGIRTMIEYPNGYKDMLVKLLNCKTYLISKDGEFVFDGITKGVFLPVGTAASGKETPCILIKNVKGKVFNITSDAATRIKFLDKNYNAIKPSDCSTWNGFYETNYSTPDAYDWILIPNQNTTISDRWIDIQSAEYIVIISYSKCTYLKVSYRFKNITDWGDGLQISDIPYIYKPFGSVSGYLSDKKLTNLRAALSAGTIYHDKANKIISIIKSDGSIGTIDSISVNGTSGNMYVTTSDAVSTLLVGDFITIDSVNYKILDIVTENGTSTISLNKALVSNLTSEAITLTAPTIVDVNNQPDLTDYLTKSEAQSTYQPIIQDLDNLRTRAKLVHGKDVCYRVGEFLGSLIILGLYVDKTFSVISFGDLYENSKSTLVAGTAPTHLKFYKYKGSLYIKNVTNSGYSITNCLSDAIFEEVSELPTDATQVTIS